MPFCSDTVRHTCTCHFRLYVLEKSLSDLLNLISKDRFAPSYSSCAPVSQHTKLLTVDLYCTLWPLEQLLPHEKTP